MRLAKTLAYTSVALALGALAPAQAAVYTATGNYNLGTDTSAGATAVAPTSCGSNSGQDVLQFLYGANSIGVHAYACDFSGTNFTSFDNGSRSSGENTFYVDGTSTIAGKINTSGGLFLFVNSGEIGAFGSTAFGAGEYQESSLSIKLIIDGNTIFDDFWDAKVEAGGAWSLTEAHGGSSSVSSSSFLSGAGWVSTVIDGGGYFFDSTVLADGEHDISYVMASMAHGNVTSTTLCRGVNQVGFVEGREALVDGIVEGPDPSFQSYCGAGARTGDPTVFNGFTLARAALPEPGSLGLLGLGLLGLPALRRRAGR